MANQDSKQVSLAEAIRQSEENIASMERDLGMLQALEQDRRAASLRLEIDAAWTRHKRLLRCQEAGCQCAENCACAQDCACAA
jgi:hypothetical protein